MRNVTSNKKNNYHILIKDTFIFALGSLGSKIITFLLVPLYTNVLSTDQYGIADLVLTCANLLVPIISLVIQDSIIRFGLSDECDKRSVLRCGLTVFLFGSLFCVVLIPFGNLYGAISEWKYYLAVISITTMASNIMFSYAKVKGQNKSYAICSIIQTAILAGTNILLLVVYKCGVKGYLTANIAAQIGSLIILCIITHSISDLRESSFDKALMKKMIAYSFPLIANNISWWILNSADRVMVEAYCDASNLGLYSAASKIPALLSVITSIFSQAWTISAIREYDHDRKVSFYENVFSVFSAVMFIGGSIIILITKPFMNIYVGRDFYEAWTMVPLLVLGAIYFAFSTFFGAIYGALKKNVRVALTTAFAASVNIIINFIFLSMIGVIAAAISTAASYFVIGFYRMIDSRKLLLFKIDYKKYILSTVIVLCQTVLVMLDVYGWIISIIAVLGLLIVHYRTIATMLNYIKIATKCK